MSDENDLTSTKTPLLEEAKKQEAAEEVVELKIISETDGAPAPATSPPKSPTKSTKSIKSVKSSKEEKQPAAPVVAPVLSNEYKFIHQRIPPRQGKLRFFLPSILILFQVVFIVLFAFFGSYKEVSESETLQLASTKDSRQYPMFTDLHAIALLGFGFLMTFLKRYGYGSVGFNLLLVAFSVQLALLVRGWLEFEQYGKFKIGINNLIFADFTAISILVAFGAVLGKTSASQLIFIALFGVVAQAVNEYINVHCIKAPDVGRSVYVHFFGAVFGLAISKALHLSGVKSIKQASVYHSDLFSLIGTIFLFAYYPSFNGILAHSKIEQDKAIVNTFAAISASCVVTFAISSLGSKGKFNVYHIQHATLAGGIAVGSVADLSIDIYVALIIGSVAGLLSTISYLFIDPFVRRFLKLHDTCSVLSLHLIPGLLASLLSALFALVSSHKEYGNDLYDHYPARAPAVNTTEYTEQNIKSTDGSGRSALGQAGFQLIALAISFGVALISGAITGLFLRLPIFEKLSQDVEMFDDEAQWVTPDDYALKLTFASSSNQTKAEEKQEEAPKVDQEPPKQEPASVEAAEPAPVEENKVETA